MQLPPLSQEPLEQAYFHSCHLSNLFRQHTVAPETIAVALSPKIYPEVAVNIISAEYTVLAAKTVGSPFHLVEPVYPVPSAIMVWGTAPLYRSSNIYTLFTGDLGYYANCFCKFSGIRSNIFRHKCAIIKFTANIVSCNAKFLADLQRVLSYVHSHEQEFIHTANEYNAQAVQRTLIQQRKELDKAQSRMSELNILFRKLYEDNALGKLSDEQFAFLTSAMMKKEVTNTSDCRTVTRN